MRLKKIIIHFTKLKKFKLRETDKIKIIQIQ